MGVSDEARRNHEELFPGHVSTLHQTDPEFIEYFDNFAFGDVLRASKLEPKTRLMLQLASMIACQALAEYRVTLAAALGIGVTPVEAKEVLYRPCRTSASRRFSTSSRHQRRPDGVGDRAASPWAIDDDPGDPERRGPRGPDEDHR